MITSYFYYQLKHKCYLELQSPNPHSSGLQIQQRVKLTKEATIESIEINDSLVQ